MVFRFLPPSDELILQKLSRELCVFIWRGLESFPIEIPGRWWKIPICGLGEITTGYISSWRNDHWNHSRRTNRPRTLEKASISHRPTPIPRTESWGRHGLLLLSSSCGRPSCLCSQIGPRCTPWIHVAVCWTVGEHVAQRDTDNALHWESGLGTCIHHSSDVPGPTGFPKGPEQPPLSSPPLILSPPKQCKVAARLHDALHPYLESACPARVQGVGSGLTRWISLMVDSCGWMRVYMRVLAGACCGGNDLVEEASTSGN